MTEEKIKQEKKATKKVVKVDEKQEYADHQEYCILKLEYENIRKESKPKYSKLGRLKELESKLKDIDGKKAKTKKNQGICKMSMRGSIVYLSQEIPNPQALLRKFTKEQQDQYFI